MTYNNIRAGRIGSILLIIILSLYACATPPKIIEPIKTEPVIKMEPALPADAIDKKISVLQDLLASNKVQEKNRDAVSRLISDYQMIKDLSQGDITQDDYRTIILMLFNNLSALDEKYLSYQEQPEDQIQAKAINDLNLKKQSILKRYIAKDYKAVIFECNEMEKAYGKDTITSETGALLAMSLAKTGKLSDAISTADRIINEMEGRPDLIQLRAGLIEWRIKTGKKEKALKEYQKLVDNMDERQALLEKTTSKINSQNKNIAGSDQALNDLINKELNSDVNARITSIMKEVDKLKGQGDFEGARLLLLKWKTQTDEPLETAEIDKAIKALDLSEKQYHDNLKNNWKEGIEAARKLIEKEEYEEAINMLDLINTGGDGSAEIKRLKDTAIENYINKERNRAAKIFQTARKTDDIKKKGDLLLTAQDILNKLIEKYPYSDMIDKIKRHMDAIKDELKKIKGK